MNLQIQVMYMKLMEEYSMAEEKSTNCYECKFYNNCPIKKIAKDNYKCVCPFFRSTREDWDRWED